MVGKVQCLLNFQKVLNPNIHQDKLSHHHHTNVFLYILGINHYKDHNMFNNFLNRFHSYLLLHRIMSIFNHIHLSDNSQDSPHYKFQQGDPKAILPHIYHRNLLLNKVHNLIIDIHYMFILITYKSIHLDKKDSDLLTHYSMFGMNGNIFHMYHQFHMIKRNDHL